MPQHDEHDDLAALDFSSHLSGSDDGHEESDADALDFSAAYASDEASNVEALDEFAPTEPEDADTEMEIIAAATEAEEDEEDEEDGLQLFTVTNPPGTVSVSAAMDGRTQRIELSPKATSMTEPELSDEILVLATLARKKGLAGQHAFVMENASQAESLQLLGEIGFDGTGVIRDFMENSMQLPTPEQAEAEQAEVFAARYTPDK
jgi:hypothetical protein